MVRQDGGGYNGVHYFPYNFALSLLIVTTNVVVLCEYLSQEFPLWGTIKGKTKLTVSWHTPNRVNIK